MVKTAWFQHRNRQSDQGIKKESTETAPKGHTSVVYDKDDSSSQWEREDAETFVRYLGVNLVNMNSRWYEKLKVKTKTQSQSKESILGITPKTKL